MLTIDTPDRPDWTTDGRDWPHRAASRFVEAGGLKWHVQEFGDPKAPVLLLLHGTGAATHSWRGLAPLLAARFRVVAPDLPGHGFTDPLPGASLSLPGMAAAVGALASALGIAPSVVAGHSAGAAVLARMCLDGTVSPRLVAAFNGALAPLPGAASLLFPSMARLLFLNPFTPRSSPGRRTGRPFAGSSREPARVSTRRASTSTADCSPVRGMSGGRLA